MATETARVEQPWAAPAGALLDALGSTPDGLGEDEARRRLAESGPNEIEAAGGEPWWRILVRQFTSPLIYILAVAAVVTLAIGEYVDAAVIVLVIGINTVLGFVQELQAERSIEALQRLSPVQATVRRDGEEHRIPARDLVRGDVVVVEAGDRVPADVRVLRARGLAADESLITGESTPVAKGEEPAPPEAGVQERTSMLFTGTVVTGGRARGVVVATGAATELGRIAGQVGAARELETPLQRRMAGLSRIIAFGVAAIAAVGFAIGLVRGEDPTELLLTMVALAVSAVPEGLPIVLTVTLAVGVRRMARRRALIRHLPAVETLGSCTVIGADKTGTLTENRMTVRRIFAGGRRFDVSGTGYDTDGDVARDGDAADLEHDGALRLTLMAGALNNEARIREEDGEHEAEGDPTEAALLVAAAKAGLRREELEQRYPRIDAIPFESERAYSATLHRDGGGDDGGAEGGAVLFVKGSPERVLAMCDEAEGVELDRDAVLAQAQEMAAEGLRVLGFAYRRYDEPPGELGEEVRDPLVLLGLQGMIDPPREEARDAVRGCHEAGIRVLMITGDHATTAGAIAADVGIAERGAEVLSGEDLERMDDETLGERLERTNVYARVAPHQKTRIVQLLQDRGEVVAVTGDGVNDAPALKTAQIGVAMGRGGTDVAREASEMIVTDDNFASIFAAVEEGRIVFRNVRNATFYLLSANLSEITIILVSLFVGIPLPLLPTQLLWLNVATDSLKDVGLAFEPGERDLARRPPRPPGEPVISRLLWERIAVVAVWMSVGVLALFVWEIENGTSEAEARTIALTTMVLFQSFHVYNSRSEWERFFARSPLVNKFLLATVVGGLVLHVLAVYTPPGQLLLRLEPIGWDDWARMLVLALTIVPVVELHKRLRRAAGQPRPTEAAQAAG